MSAIIAEPPTTSNAQASDNGILNYQTSDLFTPTVTIMLTRHSTIINNTKIYYWERNPQGAQTILFVHGFKGNHKGLTDLSEYFDGYRTILIDLPGYGESEPLSRPHTIRNYTTVLHQLMTQLNIRHFDVVGHSYGATISIIYAALHPQSVGKLVLISPGLPEESFAGFLAKSQLELAKVLPKSWRKAWLTSPLIEVLSTFSLIKSVSHKRRLELLRLGLRNAKEQHAHVIIEGLSSFLQTPILPLARHIEAPTYILAGEFDIITSLKSQVVLSQTIPSARLEMIPDIGHMAHMERPKTVSRMIYEFLYPTHKLKASDNPTSTVVPLTPKTPKQFTRTKYY
jgi:pimeloyl-ACP methyl ester carboxylesterase